MKYLVQRPHPDELLGSVWLRTRRRASLGVGVVTQSLTGRKFSPSLLAISHVGDLARALGWAPTDLLWRHTIFPYATAFVDPEVFKSSLALALSTGHSALGTSATIQSVSDHVRFRRYCSSCAREDDEAFGESYWHRAHHLPGVLLCTVHSEVLRETAIPVNQIRPLPDFLPHELRARRAAGASLGLLARSLARQSLALLNRDEIASVPRDSNWYRAQLIELGMLSRHRNVDSQLLIKWAAERSQGYVTHLGLAERDESLQWLALMVRPRIGIPFIPLKHVIFQTLLAAANPVETPFLNHKTRGNTPRPTEPLDQQYAVALKNVVSATQKLGLKIRVCDALIQAGCWATYRHTRSKFPLTQAVVAALRRSKTSVRPIK